MKSFLKKIGLLSIASFSLLSCDMNDNNDQFVNPFPTNGELNALFSDAINSRKQVFTIDPTTVNYITTTQGIELTFTSGAFLLNSAPVTGPVTVEVIEIYNRGDMLVTDKPTVAKLPGNNFEILTSGGELYVNAKQNGQQLTTSGYVLQIPAALTGGIDTDMSVFTGEFLPDGNFFWIPINQWDLAFGNGAAPAYTTFSSNFGWTNIDKFYSNPNPKTNINVIPPVGYTNANSKVFLSIDGDMNSLVNLIGDSLTQTFTFNSYPAFPIGLECHIIFISEEDGIWKYGIKPTTIQANGSYTFSASELSTSTEANLVQIINNLP
ncbi:hypothetical protein ABH942_000827 [Flavobacterium sp. 28YEA47A]|uniref:hypothetical protein n=1 Tax=Flavobacterium sp. 28YEA47A TaxID=3156276 RepID=UPI003511FF80